MTTHIHFAHANGFPCSAYTQFLTHLQHALTQAIGDSTIHRIEKMAHNPAFAVNNNWHSTADEIIDNITNATNHPVVGIGHSFGSLATLQAAIKRPELFSQLLILDPPLLMGWACWVVKLCKKLKVMDSITPSGRSKYRRTHWASQQLAFEDLRTKQLFKQFSDASLYDYVQAATHITPQGDAELHYSVNVECTVFRTMPDDLHTVRSPLPMPATLIHGEDTQVLKHAYATMLCARGGMELVPTQGGHLFPLEYPESAAHIVANTIKHQSSLLST